jgi:hypothetical protein
MLLGAAHAPPRFVARAVPPHDDRRRLRRRDRSVAERPGRPLEGRRRQRPGAIRSGGGWSIACRGRSRCSEARTRRWHLDRARADRRRLLRVDRGRRDDALPREGRRHLQPAENGGRAEADLRRGGRRTSRRHVGSRSTTPTSTSAAPEAGPSPASRRVAASGIASRLAVGETNAALHQFDSAGGESGTLATWSYKRAKPSQVYPGSGSVNAALASIADATHVYWFDYETDHIGYTRTVVHAARALKPPGRGVDRPTPPDVGRRSPTRSKRHLRPKADLS